MKHTKKWITHSLISVLITLSAIATLNFYMDPLWTFEHEHKYNQYQRGRKDRQQKSNALYFRTKKYNTLIFGSSRTINMNPHYLNDTTFNYAVNDMQPNEYNEYLDFALHKAHQPIKKVIIGLDFFGCLTYTPLIAKHPQKILEQIDKPFYKYKLFFSLDTLSYSLQNIKYFFQKRNDTYKYNYVKRTAPESHNTFKQYTAHIQGGLKSYKRYRYCTNYDINYKNEIKKLVKNYPHIKFIVFTTPVSSNHFQLMISQNLYPQYEKWLRDSVNVFHQVRHYMYLSNITKHPNENFLDSNHAYPRIYNCISDDLLHRQSACQDMSILLNKNNINTQLALLRKLNGINKELKNK